MTRLAELRALLAKAPRHFYQTFSVIASGDYYTETDENGQALYEAAVNTLPALLDVAEAAENLHLCIDHAGNCCLEWCKECQRSSESINAIDVALSALGRIGMVPNGIMRSDK